ncbi:MAG: hypothetical protein FWH23_05465 [Bacteroidales bacterium]|nr:hypothetical protein [Bacteroidales bacterium]MCL2132887.1 hypothetical protein [Bacteroidales bacterium]
MKQIKLIYIAICIAAAVTGCSNKETLVLIEPEVWTVEVPSVSKTTANVTVIFYSGGHTVIERGFCYNTTGDPTVEDFLHPVHENVSIMTATLRDLQALTTYYVRAYIKTAENELYYSSNTVSFTTEFYQVTLSTVNSIAAYSRSFTISAFAVADDEQSILRRGVVVSPSIDRNHSAAITAFDTNGGNGDFSISVPNLDAETLYYIWSFAETAAEGVVYSLRSWQASTVGIARPVSTIVGQTVLGAATLTGSHRVTLDVRVTDAGEPGATITEAGIVWSKTTNPELGALGVGHKADSRLQTLSATVSVVAAGLENNTTYYFRSYAINSEGITAYGTERSYTTRSERFFDDARDFLLPAANRRNAMFYSRTMTPVDPFQNNDPNAGSIALQNAFAADGLRWANGGYQDYMYFVFHTRETASTLTPSTSYGNNVGDSLMLLAMQYHSNLSSTANMDKTAFFGWKVSVDKATGVMTLSDFIYKPDFQNAIAANAPNATDLMENRPNVGAQLTRYFTWLTGITSTPRRLQFDYYNTTLSSGNGFVIMMPLEDNLNPNYDYLRFAVGGWGARQYPNWP